MSKPLFIPIENTFEKRAYAYKLENNVDDWATGILKIAYKQLPYLRRYEVDVELDRTDEARGYCVGKMLVYPARMQKKAAVDSEKIVSFPVIVRDRELAPFDVFSHKKDMHPAAENTVNSILLKENMFERPANPKNFRPTGLGSQLDPPSQRLRQGTGTSFEKQSSEKGSDLFAAVLPKMKTNDLEEFKMRLRSDPSLRVAAVSNPALSDAVESILTTKIASANDIKTIRHAVVKPNVMQITKKGLDYCVKTANSNCFAPLNNELSRFEIKNLLSSENIDKINSGSSFTIVNEPVDYNEVVKLASEVNKIGVYAVNSGAENFKAVVIPKMVSLEGKLLGGQILSSEKYHSVQEKIAGVFEADIDIPNSDPRGLGTFVYQRGDLAFATEPVEITNRLYNSQEKIAQYVGHRVRTGEELVFSVIPGLKKIASMGEKEVGIPDSMNFLPLPKDSVKVASDSKEANSWSRLSSKSNNSLTLISDGGSYSLRGNTPFANKIVNESDMEFFLGAHGVRPERFIKEAQKTSMPVKIASSRQVVLEEEAMINQIKNFKKVDVSGIKVDLIKEASVIVDKETVDTILSLKFVTPENVSTYVSFIPTLEKTASKLAEILTASRLGMDDVKEVAAKNAMGQLSKVIRNLKSIESKIA